MADQDTAATKRAIKAESTVFCTILRDFWDENEERQPAGKEIEVSVEVAMDGIEAGTLARVKG